MRTAEIHRRWLTYFSERGHTVVPSASLVSPDPSILFTIAGMVPFIPYIVGTEKAPWPRAVSVQKCIRTNDIENVGKTTRHGTFFQMAGNFSFGDYFKEGAIDFSWELLTTPQAEGGYGLDPERLWFTLWEEDRESYEHVTRVVGLDPARIVRLPWSESCWDTGQPGPAGSTGEWHYDRGPEFGPEATGGTVAKWPADERSEDRYIEIWNLVFDQFLRGEGQGTDYPLLGELDQRAIDTGMGVERLAYLLQGKNNMYEIDQSFGVIETASQLSGRGYASGQESDDIHLRIVGDHVRSALMLIGDGVRPGNDGRGYVLRRLIRRAVRSMRLLGVDEPAMPHLLPVSKDAMREVYPELEQNFATISQVAYEEEEAFRRTLSSGTTILDTAVKRAKSGGGSPVLGGDDAFALHDTYGFPIDLTLEMAAEQGVQVDEARFRTLMAEQRQRARADALKKKTGHVDVAVYHDFLTRLEGGDTFLGYTDDTTSARVVGLVVDGTAAPVAQAPADVEVDTQDGFPVILPREPMPPLTDELVRDYDPQFKVNPPLRTAEDVAALRAALADGTIDIIATDHAPHPREAKDCEFAAAAMGMTGLETAVGVVAAAMIAPGEHSFTWADVARTLSTVPARIGRVAHQGRPLAPGEPAHVTLIDPESSWRVRPEDLHSASENTPFTDRELPARVVATFYRGVATVLDGDVRNDREGAPA